MVEFDRQCVHQASSRRRRTDLLQRLNEGVITLEERSGRTGDLIDQMLRDAHTLKGSSRMVGLIEISDVAHRLEDIMVKVRDGRDVIRPEMSATASSRRSTRSSSSRTTRRQRGRFSRPARACRRSSQRLPTAASPAAAATAAAAAAPEPEQAAAPDPDDSDDSDEAEETDEPHDDAHDDVVLEPQAVRRHRPQKVGRHGEGRDSPQDPAFRTPCGPHQPGRPAPEPHQRSRHRQIKDEQRLRELRTVRISRTKYTRPGSGCALSGVAQHHPVDDEAAMSSIKRRWTRSTTSFDAGEARQR